MKATIPKKVWRLWAFFACSQILLSAFGVLFHGQALSPHAVLFLIPVFTGVFLLIGFRPKIFSARFYAPLLPKWYFTPDFDPKKESKEDAAQRSVAAIFPYFALLATSCGIPLVMFELLVLSDVMLLFSFMGWLLVVWPLIGLYLKR